jgi:signaling intermediate in Toll pathway protein
MENMNEVELAITALERMAMSADKSTKITVNHSDELESKDEKEEKTWIITAQSMKQKQLLDAHKKEVPIFVEGPYFCWIRDKKVEYFLMKSDPLEETKTKMKKLDEYDSDDLTKMYNMFADPSKQVDSASSKTLELSIHEQADGNIYAMCCTETRTKSSLYTWTKFLEIQTNKLKDYIIVYRYKEKTNVLAQLNEEAK